jgi:hypothetical protein
LNFPALSLAPYAQRLLPSVRAFRPLRFRPRLCPFSISNPEDRVLFMERTFHMPCERERAQSGATAMRMFLRFLIARGLDRFSLTTLNLFVAAFASKFIGGIRRKRRGFIFLISHTPQIISFPPFFLHIVQPPRVTKTESKPPLCRATVFRGNGGGLAAHYFVGTGAWGTG